ncbi:dual specificity calcium/calmodulin-dependent 3',5'-cyclic nucleotide phosphodiesterase 1-like [Condylostylus longicornis]|uniref:dual specificity calcium/calmodulin-dependent 3',5'-cyclic nucleotide phosphodiesterase 1-like n=1 Tax=Condylostylus longicornis TaxID=2530218 RepID=UPI00244E495E|nr:dual specificity calcium/calmodulin-dependent 3',5'-cyclic nucleotide phosphodiesterase 1-like [Condylostylus longicornis]
MPSEYLLNQKKVVEGYCMLYQIFGQQKLVNSFPTYHECFLLLLHILVARLGEFPKYYPTVIYVASTPENKTRDDSSVFDRRSYDTTRSKSNSPTSSNTQNPSPINGQVSKQGGLTIVRRSNSRKGNLSYQSVAQSPSGALEQQEFISGTSIPPSSTGGIITSAATTASNISSSSGTSNNIINRTSDTNPFIQSSTTSNIATTSFINNRTIEQQPQQQLPQDQQESFLQKQQKDNLYSEQYSNIKELPSVSTGTTSILTAMNRSNKATTPTGSATVVATTSGSAGSITTSASYGEIDIDTIDLTTDQLPAVDTPDACDKAAIRLRCLLRLLQRGEISAEVLQKNLHYAARVLEAVFIDETNPRLQRLNSSHNQDNSESNQKSGQVERKDSDQENNTPTIKNSNNYGSNIQKTDIQKNTTQNSSYNINLASNNPFITNTNNSDNSNSVTKNICSSSNINTISQTHTIETATTKTITPVTLNTSQSLSSSSTIASSSTTKTKKILGRTKGVSTAPQTHSGPTGPPLSNIISNINNNNNNDNNSNNNNYNNINDSNDIINEIQSLSSITTSITLTQQQESLTNTTDSNNINLINNKILDDSNCSSNKIISSDNVDSNLIRSDNGGGGGGGSNFESGNDINNAMTTSILTTTSSTIVSSTTRLRDSNITTTSTNSTTTNNTTTTDINNKNTSIDGDNNSSGNQLQDNSGDNSRITNNENKNKTTLQRRRLRTPVWARSMSNKMRLADEDDELSEVQPDAVPPEVREWLASTFTRQLATTKKRSDEKPKFRSVAHAIRAGIFVDRIYRRVSSSALMQFPPEVVKVLKNLDDWSFDVFALAEAANSQPVKYLGYDLLNRYGIIHKFKISPTVLETFLTRIEEGYCKFRNPYHNNLHAADVTQTTHHILCQTGLMNWLTDLEIFATLLAALIHDFEHTGTTNNFHVMSGSETAMLYNDRAVLENHHISAAFRVIKEDECNVLANLSREEYRELRTLVIDMVLSTDMSFHFQQLKNMKNLLTLDSPTVDKSKALALVLHCCDISHPAKKWTLHHRWTKLLLEEFFRQGDLERDLGLPFSPLCDRNNTLVAESQIGFIDFIVDPSMSVCSDMLEYILAPIAPIRTTNSGSIGSDNNNSSDKNDENNSSKPPTNSITGTTCESISENAELVKNGSNQSQELGPDGKPKFRIRKPWAIMLAENKKIWKEQAVKDAEARAAAAALLEAANSTDDANTTENAETETKTD